MAVAYRCDTGTLIADGVATGQASISFPGTQPAAGDLVVAGGGFIVIDPVAAHPSITDNQANTYEPSVAIDQAGDTTSPFGVSQSVCFLEAAKNVSSSGTFTLTFDSGDEASTYFAVGGIAFSGVNTSAPLDVVASNSGSGDVSSFATGTTAATAIADSVAVIGLAVNNTASITSLSASGFTVPIASVDGTAHAVGGLGYKILSATGTQSGTWTYGASSGSAGDGHAAVIAVYKGTGGVPTLSAADVTSITSTSAVPRVTLTF